MNKMKKKELKLMVCRLEKLIDHLTRKLELKDKEHNGICWNTYLKHQAELKEKDVEIEKLKSDFKTYKVFQKDFNK